MGPLSHPGRVNKGVGKLGGAGRRGTHTHLLGDCDRPQTRPVDLAKLGSARRGAQAGEARVGSPTFWGPEVACTARTEVKGAGRNTLGKNLIPEATLGGYLHTWGGNLHGGDTPDPVQRSGLSRPWGALARESARRKTPRRHNFAETDRSISVAVPAPPPGRRARRGIAGDNERLFCPPTHPFWGSFFGRATLSFRGRPVVGANSLA